jgi:hypothetical protein
MSGTCPTKLRLMERYLAEEQGNIGTEVKRQFLHTHRSFKAHVLDKEGKQILYVCFLQGLSLTAV